MILKVAFVLLVVWAIGVFGVYDIGDLTHVFLLGGLMMLMLGLLRARDATAAGAGPRSGKP